MKGKGKGYQGTCFQCGKVGHKKAECWAGKGGRGTYNVEEEVEEGCEDHQHPEERPIGGVWLIAGVDTKVQKTTRSRWTKSSPCLTTSSTRLKNKFEALHREEEQDEEDVGKRWILHAPMETKKCGMVFHMTDARRMLASVDKIVEAGNKVEFGAKKEDKFVMNVNTGKKIFLEKEKGVYTMKVLVESGGRKVKGTIVVDSGASECVMPRSWFPELETMEAKKGVRFAGANGNDLGNFGRKLIEFSPIAGFQGLA